MNSRIFLHLLIAVIFFSSGISRKIDQLPGNPLFLSQLIKLDKINEAQKAAQVKNLPNAPQLLSYAGYLTVNETTNSNLFFWFFPSKVRDSSNDSDTH